MELEPLGGHDVDSLATFACARSDAPYSLEVERYIRTIAPEEFGAGVVEVLGSWDGSALVAVIVYTTTLPLWHVTALATSPRYERRKQAFRLKLAVITRARAAGAAAVYSHVHRDNIPMRNLNEKLGGVCELLDPDGPYLVCTVSTTR